MQIIAGDLDGGIVYRANCSYQKDKLEIITIDDPASIATQPIAVSKESKFPLLAGRLRDAITSAQNRNRFDKLGFEWLLQ
jgi:hypothetical protein